MFTIRIDVDELLECGQRRYSFSSNLILTDTVSSGLYHIG